MTIGSMSGLGGMSGMGGYGLSETAADAKLEALEDKKRADMVKNTDKSVKNANTSGIKQAIGELR